MQVLYLGRAPRTKETLPDFLKWRQVTRHPLVFCGLTGSQRTPGDRGFTRYMQVLYLDRALCTKETLPDFLKWCRVTRHTSTCIPRVDG